MMMPNTPIEDELGNVDISLSNDTITPTFEMGVGSPNKIQIVVYVQTIPIPEISVEVQVKVVIV